MTKKIVIKEAVHEAIFERESLLSQMVRYGRYCTVMWVHGSEITAPTAGTTLVSKTVSNGRWGYIHGFIISATESNTFKILWNCGSAIYTSRIVLNAAGTMIYTSPVPLNEGMAASAETAIKIVNVNPGSAESVYQASLLYVEWPP